MKLSCNSLSLQQEQLLQLFARAQSLSWGGKYHFNYSWQLTGGGGGGFLPLEEERQRARTGDQKLNGTAERVESCPTKTASLHRG